MPPREERLTPLPHTISILLFTKVIEDNKLLNIAKEDSSCQVAIFIMKLVMNNS